MSKELIEAVAAEMNRLGYGYHESHAESIVMAMDKAAPVGEREAAIDWYNNADWGNECFKDGVVRGFQAGAAYQRAQQPQSAEAVNRAHVMDALLMWNRRHEVPPIKIGYEYGVAGAVLDLVATPQPSAGVMPEIPWQWSKSLTHCWPDDKDDRDGDWCVGCIDEDGNFYDVVKVEASQYDAAGESQKIAEAIVALWEFARLNGKEVGRG